MEDTNALQWVSVHVYVLAKQMELTHAIGTILEKKILQDSAALIKSLGYILLCFIIIFLCTILYRPLCCIMAMDYLLVILLKHACLVT